MRQERISASASIFKTNRGVLASLLDICLVFCISLDICIAL